jgi:arginine repressor
LKEQALEQLRKVNAMLQFQTTGGETSAIRRALEQLNDE